MPSLQEESNRFMNTELLGTFTVDENGYLYFTKAQYRFLARHAGIKSRKNRIVRKAAKQLILKALREIVL